MKKPFYCDDDISLKPADSSWPGIGSVYDLYNILCDVWCADTCAPRMREEWSEENRTLGQCSVTAFLAQDIFGGKVYGIPLPDGNYHCFNVVNGQKFDLTSTQFKEDLDYGNVTEQFRKVHFAKEEKHQRYLKLKDLLKEKTGRKPIRLIVCDLDETLIRKDRTIHPDCIAAIRELQKKGILFVPATGRGYTTVSGTLKELDLFEKENQYVMSFNGGALTENKGTKVLYFRDMDRSLVQKLFERGLRYDAAVRVYTADMVYVFHMTEEERQFSKGRSGVTECAGEDLSFLDGQPIVKIVYANSNFPYLRSIEDDMKDLKDELDISYSSGRYMEFNPKGINKGTGLQKLADLLGIPMSQTMAIGDNFNDLPMIRAAAAGVGTANTNSQMKRLCPHLTERTCEEGAVAEAVERFI